MEASFLLCARSHIPFHRTYSELRWATELWSGRSSLEVVYLCSTGVGRRYRVMEYTARSKEQVSLKGIQPRLRMPHQGGLLAGKDKMHSSDPMYRGTHSSRLHGAPDQTLLRSARTFHVFLHQLRKGGATLVLDEVRRR